MGCERTEHVIMRQIYVIGVCLKLMRQWEKCLRLRYRVCMLKKIKKRKCIVFSREVTG